MRSGSLLVQGMSEYPLLAVLVSRSRSRFRGRNLIDKSKLEAVSHTTVFHASEIQCTHVLVISFLLRLVPSVITKTCVLTFIVLQLQFCSTPVSYAGSKLHTVVYMHHITCMEEVQSSKRSSVHCTYY